MTDVELAAANLSEPLTWTQVRERYPDEWVVLVEVDRVEKDEDCALTERMHDESFYLPGTMTAAIDQPWQRSRSTR